VLIGPFAATIVDRADIRTVLIVSNVGRALATAALIFAPNPAIVLAIVFIRSSVDSAFTPARQAALQIATPPELLPVANGAHQGINQISKIVGPALGGLALTMISPQAIFGINASLSLLAAVILLGLRLPDREVSSEARKSIFADVPAGLQEFARNRKLLGALIFASSAYFAFFLYDTLIALLAVKLGFDASIYGLSITISGLGGLIGALVAGTLDVKRPVMVMALAALVSAPITIILAAYAMAGIEISLWAFYAAMAIMGGSTAFMLVPYRTIIQKETPGDRIARVVATGEAVSMMAMLSAPFLGSLIAETFGVGAAFLAGGILLLSIGTIAMLTLLKR
jgi:predicted MFS family arabinose efflux permease